MSGLIGVPQFSCCEGPLRGVEYGRVSRLGYKASGLWLYRAPGLVRILSIQFAGETNRSILD